MGVIINLFLEVQQSPEMAESVEIGDDPEHSGRREGGVWMEVEGVSYGESQARRQRGGEGDRGEERPGILLQINEEVGKAADV